MDELIKQLTSQLGIDESVAKNAAGKAMAMVKSHAGDDLFSKISSAVPGVEEMAAADDDDAAEPAGGGMLGKLAGMASSAIGGKAGGGLEIASALTSTGLGTDQVGGFMTMLVNFLKEKVGSEVMDQVLGKFPMLKTLIG